MLPSIHVSCHDIYRDESTGLGYLVPPVPADDVPDRFGMTTLCATDWDAAVRRLRKLGWTIMEGEDGLPLVDGQTVDGRDLIAIYWADPDNMPVPVGPWQPEVEMASLTALARTAGGRSPRL